MRKAAALAQPSAIMAPLTDVPATSQSQATSASAPSFSIVSFRPFNKQRAPTYKQANYVDDARIGEQLRRQLYSPDCERFAAVAGSFAFHIIRLRVSKHLLAILTLKSMRRRGSHSQAGPNGKQLGCSVESRTMLRELMMRGRIPRELKLTL